MWGLRDLWISKKKNRHSDAHLHVALSPSSAPDRLLPVLEADGPRLLDNCIAVRLSVNPTTNDTWGWDGKEWTQLAEDGPRARAMGALAYDEERERVVLFGGRLGWPNDANDTWEWDGSA